MQAASPHDKGPRQEAARTCIVKHSRQSDASAHRVSCARTRSGQWVALAFATPCKLALLLCWDQHSWTASGHGKLARAWGGGRSAALAHTCCPPAGSSSRLSSAAISDATPTTACITEMWRQSGGRCLTSTARRETARLLFAHRVGVGLQRHHQQRLKNVLHWPLAVRYAGTFFLRRARPRGLSRPSNSKMLHGLRVAAVAAIAGVALAIPHPKYARESTVVEEFAGPAVPPAVLTGCKNHTLQADCSADKCCTWCGPKTAPVPVGWCMPVLPVATSLTCDKAPSSCATVKVNTTCLATDGCKWLDYNSSVPGKAAGGMCMYDWDTCKPPPTPSASVATHKSAAEKRLARKHKNRAIAAPVPPAPKLNCTVATAEECDAKKCCQWCGSAMNATSPGWCMPMLDVPIPMLQCSKSGVSCTSLPAATCNATDACSWMPFGPPGTSMGVCIFDWKKCTAV